MGNGFKRDEVMGPPIGAMGKTNMTIHFGYREGFK
jgi:hypothetical protein